MSEKTGSASSHPLTGRCLCGAIRYELDAAIRVLVNCHCQFCRRAHGAAFVTTSPVPTTALRIVQGEDQLARCDGRFYCQRCASRLFNRGESFPNVTALVVTSLDEEPTLKPSAHLNLESMAPWYEILDDAARYDAFPPDVSEALSAPSNSNSKTPSASTTDSD